MRKTIKINGTDYTTWTPPAGYEVYTKPVYGGNKMTMATGTEFNDEIARLSVITMPFMPLTDTQLSALTQNLFTAQTCLVYFFDPDINAYRTIKANRDLSKRKHKGSGADGKDYWTGIVCTFEETD